MKIICSLPAYSMRIATEDDIPRIVKFRNSAYTDFVPPTDAAGVKRWLDNKKKFDRMFLFEDGSKIVALSNCSLKSDKVTVVINLLLVDPDSRSTGIGSYAINRITQYYKKLKFETLCIGVEPDNKRAYSLYEKLGFRKSKRLLIDEDGNGEGYYIDELVKKL